MELLDSCRGYAHKFYRDLMVATEKTLDDALFELAKNSKSNEEQQRFYEAIQVLKNRGGAMQATFQQAMVDGFQDFVSGKDDEHSVDEQIDITTLSLVQRDELEDELAISVIVSKSNSRNSESLWKLNKRLAVLRGGKNVSDENNPFGPAKVCEALQKAIHQLEMDGKTRITLYKHFGKMYVVSFNKVLQGLNDLMTDKGILPNLRFSAANSDGAALPGGAAAPIEDDGIDRERLAQEQQTSIAHQQHLYDSIRDMQSTQGPRSHTIGGVSFGDIATDSTGGADAFSAVDYALVLSAIQQSKDLLSSVAVGQPLRTEVVEEQLFGQLSQVADKNSHHKMTRDDANTVDLVGMIFRYMLDDENLHDVVKSLLSNLHTPYLKLALTDNTFLDNYQHSARILINSMAEVGGRWIRDKEDRTVLPKIKTIVETVLKGFVDDASIFDRLLEDFTRFKDNLEKRSRMVEQRNTESQQGMERLEVSKHQAADELEQRMEKRGVSDKVREILRKPWSDFLAFNLLRHGVDSLTWQSALKVVDGVIWSMKAPESEDKDKLRRHQEDIEKSVRGGLETIGYDGEATQSLLNSLKEAHDLVYHRKLLDQVNRLGLKEGATKSKLAAQPKPKPVPESKPSKQAKAVKKREVPPTAEERKAIVSLESVNFGTWFEFQRPEDTADKLKLAWFSKVSSRYMFVDHAGVKQAVETRIELARGMAAGLIKIIELEKKSFMERALEAVFSSFKIGAGT
jgi:hypothetical protein